MIINKLFLHNAQIIRSNIKHISSKINVLRTMSSKANVYDDFLTEFINNKGLLTINRPKAMNSQTNVMVK